MPHHRKRPLSDPERYYAYVWRLDGVVLWVGQGKDNRGRPTAKQCWNGRPEKLKELLRARAAEIEWKVYPCASQALSRELEKKLIKRLKPIYNTATNYGGWKGMHSKEGLLSISRASTGRTWSEERKKRHSQKMLGNTHLLGHKCSEETKQKIRDANRQRIEASKRKLNKQASERN